VSRKAVNASMRWAKVGSEWWIVDSRLGIQDLMFDVRRLNQAFDIEH
jgi:hypothetical protein